MKFQTKKGEADLPDCKEILNKVLGNKVFSVNTVPVGFISKNDRLNLLEDVQNLVTCMGSQLHALKRFYETE